MAELENHLSVFDVFASSQETFEEAKKKSSEESGKRVNYLRFSQDGTYVVRILPLAPVIDADGRILPLERKGYEYPLRSLMLKIEDPSKVDKKGKHPISYVSVCHAKYAFPQLESDLIDKYVSVACELYESDTNLCKKLRDTSFNGGLKWDSRRCMYVIDCNKRADGIQILQLSYAQYKEIEERKLNLWNKLNKGGKNVPCPISSINQAYPLEVVRKTEAKTSYSFNIDIVSGIDTLDADTLQKLLDAPRLPEVLYRYTRFHLEATVAFLHQLDEKYDIKVMDDARVKECIEQIKMLLPADDQSHFTIGGNTSDSGDDTGADDLDGLWARFDKLEEAGLDDKSAEGQELRTSIKEYIENQELDIRITRKKTNQDLLEEIEGVYEGEEDEDELEEEAPVAAPAKPIVPEEDEEEPEEDDAPAQEPAPVVRERNEDTNEPAARPHRRGAHPARRR